MKPVLPLLLCSCAFAQPAYELLLKGGHLIDPRSGISAPRDVAIAGGRIARIGASIPASSARKVVDVSGLYVTPGLVDIHVHVFAGEGAEYTGVNSVFPDSHTFRYGVTAVVDAGSSGWKNFADFRRRIVKPAKTRVLAFVNIVGAGMAGNDTVEQNTAEMDAQAAARCARENKDLIVGIKSAHYHAPNWIAVDRAVEAGKLAGLPVMVDFGRFQPERPFEEMVTRRLRPGDIYTHAYLAWVPMLDAGGKVRPYLFEARKRGVIFDAGHGGGSFVFRNAVPAMRQGFVPDSISTDLHIGSMNSGMKDMLNVMSKFLNMGMALDEVILRSTWKPARIIRREELGHLSKGAAADVAVLRVEKGSFGFVDSYGARLRGSQRLSAELTLRDGIVVWDRHGLTREDWDRLGNYGPQGHASWDGTIPAGTRAGGAQAKR